MAPELEEEVLEADAAPEAARDALELDATREVVAAADREEAAPDCEIASGGADCGESPFTVPILDMSAKFYRAVRWRQLT
jgi:hypothetical protein